MRTALRAAFAGLILFAGAAAPSRVPPASAAPALDAPAPITFTTQLPPPLRNVTAVSGGGWHSCAVIGGGGVRCWGFNLYGQLGDGTTDNRTIGVPVAGLASGVTALAAGANHTCALTEGGGVKCWGANFEGALGDGTTVDSERPRDVLGLEPGVRAIAAGRGHSCALTQDGGVKCWGRNRYGQLGDGTTTNRLTPVTVSGLATGVRAIACGSDHTCAVTVGGALKCWGSNWTGQLGDGTDTDRLTPRGVSGLGSGVSSVAPGQGHTCAVTTGGGVKCWGSNWTGQLGDGTTLDKSTPVNVTGLTSGVVAVGAGSTHTCALMTGGGVKCWGRNAEGQLGNGSTANSKTPVNVSGLLSGVSAISVGYWHSLALTPAGVVRGWGENGHNQLGSGLTVQRLAPAQVSGLASGVRAIEGGEYHTCALTDAGVTCWGWNWDGQLGDGSVIGHPAPANVLGLPSGISAISAGDDHVCALTAGGGVKCWGGNWEGQLGDGSTSSRLTPVNVSGLASGVRAIAAGGEHTCALTTAGAVRCWGNNDYGQLGDGTTTRRTQPVNVTGLGTSVTALAAGWAHTCALTTAGGVMCWGANWAGQLGDGTSVDRRSPVPVSGLGSGVIAVSGGSYHSCALTKAGGVKCWGDNGWGQLGNDTVPESRTPVDVPGLAAGVGAIATGGAHTCALTTGGEVKCWGGNRAGQVGDGTTIHRTAPVTVLGLASGVQAIAAGDQHTCAITAAGAALCWGADWEGQLGLGTAVWPTAPLDALDLWHSYVPYARRD